MKREKYELHGWIAILIVFLIAIFYLIHLFEKQEIEGEEYCKIYATQNKNIIRWSSEKEEREYKLNDIWVDENKLKKNCLENID